MRERADVDRIRRFMRELGAAADAETTVYFTGGATAVLIGWRHTTIDIDVHIVPDTGPLFGVIAGLKEALRINVELASPSDFIPELPGWRDRSVFVAREGNITFYHYDFYAQALAKIERGHDQDRQDVIEMIARGLVEPVRGLGFFDAIVPQLERYPAIDPKAFRQAAAEMLR